MEIWYRSGWELKAMQHFDQNPNVLEWSSEEYIIPYVSAVDGKWHRYFPDFYIKVRTKTGEVKEYICEVKPKAQTQEPKVQKRKTKKYIYEVLNWGVNTSKWEAAHRFCQSKGWEFKILTETDLGV
jgi:predicted nucleotidyltransferase